MHAAPNTDGFESAMARGGALSEEGKHAEAFDAFEAAYAAMPAEIKVGNVGEFVVYSGASSALRAYNEAADPALLRRAKTLLESFVADVEGAPAGASTASTDRAKTNLSMLDTMLDTAEPDPIEPVPSTSADEREPSTETAPAEPERDTKPSKVGLALTVVGGLTTAAGLGLIVAGTQQVRWYEQELDEFGWEPDSTVYDYEAKLDEARRVRNIDIGIGAGLAAVGVGLAVYGIIRIKKDGRSSASARVRRRRLALEPRGAGLRVRF